MTLCWNSNAGVGVENNSIVFLAELGDHSLQQSPLGGELHRIVDKVHQDLPSGTPTSNGGASGAMRQSISTLCRRRDARTA
jgi:hypothetical protein